MDSLLLRHVFNEHKEHQNAKCIFCFPAPEMKLLDLGNMHLLLDTFPVCAGHALLSSKRHYGCLGDLPQEEIQKVGAYLETLNGDFVLYEHGRAGGCGVNKENCEHFHINIIPVPADFCPVFPLMKVEPLTALSDVQDFYHKKGQYLLLIMKRKIHIFAVPKAQSLPPHFLRSKVCQALGVPHLADWKNYNDFDRFAKSYSKAQELYL